MKKKILIVGGTGFIGRHLTKKCLSLNWQVTSISSSIQSKKKTQKNVKYLYCDISKKKIFVFKNKKKKEFDYIVNLGGYVDHKKRLKHTIVITKVLKI